MRRLLRKREERRRRRRTRPPRSRRPRRPRPLRRNPSDLPLRNSAPKIRRDARRIDELKSADREAGRDDPRSRGAPREARGPREGEPRPAAGRRARDAAGSASASSRSGSRSSRRTSSKLPEAADVVSVGEFPGSFRIPGTDAALKIGGQVRVTAVESLDAIGTDDRFVTSSIPVEGSEAAGKGARTTLAANPEPVQLRLPDADGRRRDACVHRGRASAGRSNGDPPPRVRPVGPLDPRPDVVHVLRSRGRAVRDRQRGPERDLALPPAADPVHDDASATSTRSPPRSRTRRRTSRTPPA